MSPEEYGRRMADLDKAKDAVRWLLEHMDGFVDMHGLEYWAARVVALRKELVASL